MLIEINWKLKSKGIPYPCVTFTLIPINQSNIAAYIRHIISLLLAVTIDSLNRIRDACNLAVGRGCFAIPLSNDKQCGIDQGAKSVETSETVRYFILLLYISYNFHPPL